MAQATSERASALTPEQLGEYVDIHGWWMYQAGIGKKIYYQQPPESAEGVTEGVTVPETLPNVEHSRRETPLAFGDEFPAPRDISHLVVAKLEEWGELITALVQPRTRQASRLLELSDIFTYSLHYGGHIRQKDAPNTATFSIENAQAGNQKIALSVLLSELENLPQHDYSDHELQQILARCAEAMVVDVCHHFELAGYHPNGSSLAEIKLATLQESVLAGLRRVTEQAQKGEVSKAFLKETARQMAEFSAGLPQEIRLDAQASEVVAMVENLLTVSDDVFAYPTLDLLGASMLVRAEVLDPRTGQIVQVAGKNARNYPPQELLPPGWTLREVRALRNFFPDSIIPSDFRLGIDSPEAYLAKKTQEAAPLGAENEVRRFDRVQQNDLR